MTARGTRPGQPAAAPERGRAGRPHRRPAPAPVRYDGQPLRHLSHSSYTRFLLCPEDWRRHYLKGERTAAERRDVPRLHASTTRSPPTTAAMLEHGETLTLDQLHDAYRDHWTRELAAEQRQARRRLGRRTRRAGAPSRSACEALDARASPSSIPQLGRPVAVQRKLEFALAPGLEWTIQCFLDLETVSATDDGERGARDRRLQGQEHAALPGQGRPRPAGRPLPRRPGRSGGRQRGLPMAAYGEIPMAAVTKPTLEGERARGLPRLRRRAAENVVSSVRVGLALQKTV